MATGAPFEGLGCKRGEGSVEGTGKRARGEARAVAWSRGDGLSPPGLGGALLCDDLLGFESVRHRLGLAKD